MGQMISSFKRNTDVQMILNHTFIIHCSFGHADSQRFLYFFSLFSKTFPFQWLFFLRLLVKWYSHDKISLSISIAMLAEYKPPSMEGSLDLLRTQSLLDPYVEKSASSFGHSEAKTSRSTLDCDARLPNSPLDLPN